MQNELWKVHGGQLRRTFMVSVPEVCGKIRSCERNDCEEETHLLGELPSSAIILQQLMMSSHMCKFRKATLATATPHFSKGAVQLL